MQALRFVFVIMAIAIGVLIGRHGLHSPAPNLRATQPAAAMVSQPEDFSAERGQIAARLADAPAYIDFFTDLKRSFPDDYESIFADFAARAASSGQVESPDFYLAETLRRLRRTRGILAAQATDAPLTHLFDVQAQILSKLTATAPPLCADFLYGGASDAFLDFSSKNRDLMANLAEAGLAAIRDGQARKVERPAPTEKDFNQLEDELITRGLNTTEISVLLDGSMPDPPLPAPRMCALGSTYLDALQGLPNETRLKMLALAVELMARS